jgi:hypothetical protein
VNLLAARIELRVRSATDVLDLAAPLALRNWRVFGPLAAVVLLPAFAACLVVRYRFDWTWPAVWVMAVVLGAFTQVPFTLACGDLLFSAPRDVRVRPLLRRSLARLPAFLLAYLLTRLAHLAGLMVLVLPLFTASWFFVVPEVLLLERATPFGALGRSMRAVRGRASAAFGVTVALLLLAAAGVAAGEALGSSIVNTVLQLGEPFGQLLQKGGTPYALAGFFLTVPVIAAARFLAYTDLRTRKEGWDIQLRFMAIAAEAEETARLGRTGGAARRVVA